MAIRFEKVHGRTMEINPVNPTVVEKYRFTRSHQDSLPAGHAGGIFDYVADYALFAIPRSIDYNPVGTLWLQDIKINEVTYAREYLIDAPYASIKKESGAYQLTVDLIGGTTHVKAGVLINIYPPGTPDNGGIIGYDRDSDTIHGAEVVTPEMKIIVSYRAPQNFLNAAYIKRLFYVIGHFNSDTFLTFEPGEVQYIGGPFTESESEATARFTFAVSPNETDLDIGGVTVSEKKGSDLISPIFLDIDIGGKPRKEVDAVEVIRPPSHSWVPFVPAFGWGG